MGGSDHRVIQVYELDDEIYQYQWDSNEKKFESRTATNNDTTDIAKSGDNISIEQHKMAAVNEIGYVYWEITGSDLEFDTITNMSATAVDLRSFTAEKQGDGVLLRWETGWEVDNLGFHIYREQDGRRVRITPPLIAGGALIDGSLSGNEDMSRHYVWWDEPSTGEGPVRYWLEDVDLNGKRSLHGPVEVKGPWRARSEKEREDVGSAREGDIASSPLGGADASSIYGGFSGGIVPWALGRFHSDVQARAVRSPSLSELGGGDSYRAEAVRERIEEESLVVGLAPVGGEEAGVFESSSFLPSKASGGQLSIKKSLKVHSEGSRELQWRIASGNAVKILVREDGWYRVGQPELVDAGLDPEVDPAYLKLYMNGKEQPIVVNGEDDGRFDPQDAVEFFGQGLDTPYSDTRVYWLVVGSTPGKRVALSQGSSNTYGETSFPSTVELRERLIYFAALKNGDSENFFGRVVTADGVDQVINLSHVDPSPPGDAELEVVLQGVTAGGHVVKVLLNDVEVGEVTFDGQAVGYVRIPVLQSGLMEGDNLVTLRAEGGETDVSLVDRIRLTYWRTYTAEDGMLEFTARGGSSVVIRGFGSPWVSVMDVTEPNKVSIVESEVWPDGYGYAVEVDVPGMGERRLLAVSDEAVRLPAFVVPNAASSWNKGANSADLVIISHADFMESLGPLADLRRSQGWAVAIIDVQDIYDEFSFGHKDPQAIKDFLARARRVWDRAPGFVLLVGDSSFDPRDYLGYGPQDFVPTKLLDTEYLETASDDWFADFNGDHIPEMAVGRLPVSSAQEAALVVSKIVDHEGTTLRNYILFAADQNDEEYDFESYVSELEALVPEGWEVEEVFRGSSPSPREDLLAGLNRGPVLVDYLGHGSVDVWRGGFFSGADALGLTNGPDLSFYVSMTCLNGFFQAPYMDSLAEALMKSENGGAAAVWTSSGLTSGDVQADMNKALFEALFMEAQTFTIGEAVIQAKRAILDSDVRKTWILFGDPTMRLR